PCERRALARGASGARPGSSIPMTCGPTSSRHSPASERRAGGTRPAGVPPPGSAGTRALAAPLHQHDVTPPAEVAAEPFPRAHDPEPGPLVQPQAGGVLGKDAGLDGPDAGR